MKHSELELLAWLDAGQQADADYAAGQEKAISGKPFISCANRHQREGWLAEMRAADVAVDAAQYTPRPGFDF